MSFLAGLPDDFDFVLALHEGSVVGIATGAAIASQRPALVLLHTTAGLGNAVSALATARVNRAPLLVLVGQQDRRHLAFQPFLAGDLDGLAGNYPVWVGTPAKAQDVPGCIARAYHESITGSGPALVVVPMDDWSEPAGEGAEHAAPQKMLRPAAADDASVSVLADLVEASWAPAIVVGAGADDDRTWAALTALSERLGCPVYQESFGARAGFPQDHENFAGHLPADRARLRQMLSGHDTLLVVGAPVFRQYAYAPGSLVEQGMRVALVTQHADEAHRSPAEVVVLGTPSAVCSALVERIEPRPPAELGRSVLPSVAPPGPGERMLPTHVFSALRDRIPRETVLVEETPSSRLDLHATLPARVPLGFLSAAAGGLGFAIPAAIGVRMAAPKRPVVAVVGDGSSLYQIQALWSAARYRVGVLIVVLVNGRYAIMDQLAAREGGTPPWPSFEEVDVAALARALGCQSRRISTHPELLGALDDVLPSLHERHEPLLLAVDVAAPDVTSSSRQREDLGEEITMGSGEAIEQQLLIGGSWEPAASGATFERQSPFTGDVITVAASAGREDARRAVDAAKGAFAEWAATPPTQRRKILNDAADLLMERAPEIASVMTQEVGATFGWGMFNCDLAARMLREAAAQVNAVKGEVLATDVPGATSMGVRQPVGVVVGMAPWNAPVILATRAVATPLAYGNTVVLKASEKCPRVHAAVVEALNDAGAPAGAINLIIHSESDAPDVVDELIAHPDVRRVNFTGSTRVGRIIASKCAEHLKRCLLELGGKAPQVVLADADLEEAANAASFGAFMNAGQICMSTERVVVERQVSSELRDKLVHRAASLTVGDPSDAATMIGPVIDDASRERLLAMIEDARSKGAEVLAGGQAEGNLVTPTVIAGVTPEMSLYAEESFGPVVTIVEVDNEDEAVGVANDSEYGLSAAVFSGDTERALAVARRIESGICHVNSSTVDDEPQVPFGGVKSSGWGRFGGSAALEEFTELRWITFQDGERHYPI